MAGTHQYNKLIAMMDNWNKVQALTETAQNSDGTAEKKFNDNYMNSLEAKTNALKASLENVATSVVSDDMYAGFLDGAKAVADFTAQTDLLKASLVGLGAAGGVYAFGWIQNLIQDFSNLGKAMDILKAGNLTDAGFENLLNLTQDYPHLRQTFSIQYSFIRSTASTSSYEYRNVRSGSTGSSCSHGIIRSKRNGSSIHGHIIRCIVWIMGYTHGKSIDSCCSRSYGSCGSNFFL